MRAILLSTLALLTATSLLPAQRRRGQDPGKLENFTFEDERFQSKSVGKRMAYGIYLPKDYDDEANKDKTWPLIIWLHGMWEDHMRFHRRGGAPLLDQAVSDGKLPPCIFVTANGSRSSMYVNREDEKWEDLISKDLLAHVSKNFRVSKERKQRALMGISMGGMGALRIAMTKPGLFGAVAAHSSAVFAENPDDLPPRMKSFAKRLGLDAVFGDPIQKEPWQKANPVCIARQIDTEKLQGLRIYFDAGTRDRMQFDAGNKLLHEALKERKVKHTWRLIEGGGHSWGDEFQHEALPHSLAFVGKTFLAPVEKPKAASKDAGDKQSGDKLDREKGK